MSHSERKSLLVDQRLQFAVASRVIVYFVASILFVAMSLTFWKTYVSEGGTFIGNLVSTITFHLPVFLTSLLFLPFAIFDILKVSHRFAGPIYRLRRDLDAFKTDTNIRTKIRKSDYFQELPESVNELLDELENLRHQAKQEAKAEVLV